MAIDWDAWLAVKRRTPVIELQLRYRGKVLRYLLCRDDDGRDPAVQAREHFERRHYPGEEFVGGIRRMAVED